MSGTTATGNALQAYAGAVVKAIADGGATDYTYEFDHSGTGRSTGHPDISLAPGEPASVNTDCSGWVSYAMNSVAPVHAAMLANERTIPIFNKPSVTTFDGKSATFAEAANYPFARADVLTYAFGNATGQGGFAQIGDFADLQAGDLVAYSLGVDAYPEVADPSKVPGLVSTKDTGHTMIVVGAPVPVPRALEATGTSHDLPVAEMLSPDAVAVYAVPVVDCSAESHFGDLDGFATPLADSRSYAETGPSGGVGTGTMWFAVDENGRAIQYRFAYADPWYPNELVDGTFRAAVIAAARPLDAIDLSAAPRLDGNGQLEVRVYPNAQPTLGGTDYAVREVLTGAAGLRVVGDGTLTLSAAGSTYSGGTTIAGGTLRLAATGAAGTGFIRLDDAGSTLRVDAGVTVGNTVDNLQAGRVDFAGLSFDAATELVQQGSTLTLRKGDGAASTLNLSDAAAARGALTGLGMADDGSGGTSLSAANAARTDFIWAGSADRIGVAAGHAYAGPVEFLTRQYAFDDPSGRAVLATARNAYVRGGSGSDAIGVTGGSNVLDGGGGSNFLVGAGGDDGGHDTFYVDARLSEPKWDTIVNFHAGDVATVWGVRAGPEALSWRDGAGAAGYTGATLTLAGADAAVTFAGLTVAEARAGFTVSTGEAGGLGYTMIAFAGHQAAGS